MNSGCFRPFASFVVVAVTSVVFGQSLPPSSPLELARGLREQGLADLAVEYLDEGTAKWPADVQKEVLLERAKCRLEQAAQETDEGDRDAQIAQAKAEFDGFLKANPNHPRAAEANVARARLDTLEGKAELQRAKRLTDEKEKAKAFAASRPFFQNAAKAYGSAAGALEAVARQAAPGSPRQRELTRDYYQTLLDEGLNNLLLAESYYNARDAEIEPRDKAVRTAQKLFDKLSEIDPTHPLCWVARAWHIEGFSILGERTLHESKLKALIEEGRKPGAPPAAAAAVRMARFFLLRELFANSSDPTSRGAAMTACRAWLNDYPAAKPNAESNATNYYLGTLLLNEGLKRENMSIERIKPEKAGDPTVEKVTGVKPDGLQRLKEADVQFRKVLATENDYTERATRQRARTIRWLVGNIDRPTAAYATFDECYMAALLQLEKARPGSAVEGDQVPKIGDDERAAAKAKAIELLEKARTLPVPKESERDRQQAIAALAVAYNGGNRPYQGAVLAESLARASKSPGKVARYGAMALFGYDQAFRLNPRTSAEMISADRNRLLSLCDWIEKQAPNEPIVDDIRLQHAILLSQIGSYEPMFRVLAAVPNTAKRIATMRLFQGVAAYELVRPRGADEVPLLDPTKQKETLTKAIADLTALPMAKKEANRFDALDAFNAKLQLAQLQLLNAPEGAKLAEAILAETQSAAKAFPDLPDLDRKKLLIRIDLFRLRAVHGQAMALFNEGKFAESADRFAPLLNETIAAGPAANAQTPSDLTDLSKSLDAERIRLLLVPTLNARIREGAVDKTGKLLEELKKFGGDLTVTARVVQQGVTSIKPTIAKLKAEGKGDEAGKLVAAVAGIVDMLAAEKNLPLEVLYNLGKSFRDLGEPQKAIELLERVPIPTDEAHLKGEAKLEVHETAPPEERKKLEQAFEANRVAALVYRLSRLELARIYRSNKQFDKVDAILDDALGKEANSKELGVKDRQGGWGAKVFDFRREYFYSLDDKARDTQDWKVAAALFNQAIKQWASYESSYRVRLQKINAPMAKLKLELKRLSDASDKGEAVGDEIAKVQQQMGEIERQMNAIKPAWHDVMIEKWSVQAGAFVAQAELGKGKPAAEALAGLATTIVDFEKQNAPLTEAVHRRLHELLNAQPVLKDLYAKKDGKLLLEAPKK